MVDPLGLVVVRGGAQGFVQEISLGRHRLIADEPVAAGGTDRGPGPYDLLLAASAATRSGWSHSFGTILRLAKSPSEPFPTHNPTRPLAR